MATQRVPQAPMSYAPHPQVAAHGYPYTPGTPVPAYMPVAYAPAFQPNKALRTTVAVLFAIATLWFPTIVVVPVIIYTVTGWIALPIIMTLVSFCYSLALIPTIVNLPYAWSKQNLGRAFKLVSYRAWRVFAIGSLVILTFGIVLFFVQATSMFSGQR